MNNQYQHFEQPLTPSIAQELIQELFAGQTVQKQGIVSGVDEAHSERGGHPPRAQGHHPVTTALISMKKSRLIHDAGHGFWFILPYIKTLNEFLQWASQFDSGEDSEKYLFRGVSSTDYKIDASAYRRLKKGRDRDEEQVGDFEALLRINRDLIRDASFRGHDQKNGRKLEDLEILAEFQHYGAATFLMDFTYNALVALWFACKRNSKNASNAGRVVAVRPDTSSFPEVPSEFSVITLDTLRKKIDSFFRDREGNFRSKLYQWQPRHQNNRIIAQQSIFLFGVLEITPDKECIVDGSNKDKIRTSLKRIYGITEDTLFPDFDGFAQQHNQEEPYTQPSTAQYREIADEVRQRGQYEDAIAGYNEVIRLNPDDISYYLRGLAKTYLGQYESALADFNDAIRLRPNEAELYHQSGFAKTQLGQYESALADFNEAIRLNPHYSEIYYRRGFLKGLLEQDDEAITDYDEAIRLTPNYAEAYFQRGLTRAKLEQLELALVDYDEAIRLTSNYTEAYSERGVAKVKLGQYEQAISDFNVAIQLDPDYAHAYFNQAIAKFHLQHFNAAREDLERALTLTDLDDDAELINNIEYLLYEINSRTVGESQDE